MASDSQIKRRIEAEYAHDDRTDEIGTTYAGQLTILFCADVDAVTDIATS